MPRYLEQHAQRIRSKYLAFVHDLGEHRIAGKRVIDHLHWDEELSLWWMTLLAEKSPLKSPRIYDCLRLIALEEMLLERRPATLTLISTDRELAEALRETCRRLGISFRVRLLRGTRSPWSIRRIYQALPQYLQGVLSLRHLCARWPLRKLRQHRWFTGADSLFICSYFVHLDPGRCAHGDFYSRQWETLPKSLHEAGRRTNWIQLFMLSPVVPDARTGAAWLRGFNDDAVNQGCHAFLDSYLTFGLMWRLTRRWRWLISVSRRLKSIDSAFYPAGSAVWLWPLLRADWLSSLVGPVALSNCLCILLFDRALAEMPRQGLGLYLCENQAWEKALLRAWRRHRHGRIIGVQHSTAPFWHLYYFDDPRCRDSHERCPLPLPDQLAVNGAAAHGAFIESGFPPQRLVEVEALRYLNLAGSRPRAKPPLDCSEATASAAGGLPPTVRVLVLGDMIAASVDHLFCLLEAAIPHISGGIKLTFKAHPGYAVDLAAHPTLSMQQTEESLSQILSDFDAAVAANSTSACVDAYVAGLPVIVNLDGDGLNLSPLRGQPGVYFVSSAAEMIEALRKISEGDSETQSDRAEFFCLDRELPRWKRLLELASTT